MTANDYGLGLYNGDTGVTVVDGGTLRAVVGGAGDGVDVRDESGWPTWRPCMR